MKILELLGITAGQRLSVDEEINKKAAENNLNRTAFGTAVISKPRLLTTKELLECYGKPGDPANLVTVDTPFPFKLDWAGGTVVNKITIHKKVAPRFIAFLNDLLAHYGLDRIKELGIDQFAGCFNFRPQRGLEKKYAAAMAAKNYALAYTYLSRHAWAAAFDLDADRNQLKWKKPKAQFSKPEYKLMFELAYKNGFISYGIERDNDYMHIEIGVLL